MKFTKNNIIDLQFSYEDRPYLYTIYDVRGTMVYAYYKDMEDDREWSLNTCLGFLNSGAWKFQGYKLKYDCYEIY